MKKKLITIVTIVLIIFFLDQITKIYAINFLNGTELELIPNILKLKYTENTGGAFGVGQNSTMTFVITNIIVLGIIIKFIIMQIERIDIKTIFIISFVLAGGISNLIDRVVRGFVVDFIYCFPNTKLPIFNLADSFIVIGWILLAFVFAIHTWKDKNTDIKKNNSKVE